MIKLSVMEKCQECGYFEPYADGNTLYAGGKIIDRTTTVRCIHSAMCNDLERYLKERMDEKLE